MRLLILGVGGHGKICSEIAIDYVWDVDILDDAAEGAVGKMDEYGKLLVCMMWILW